MGNPVKPESKTGLKELSGIAGLREFQGDMPRPFSKEGIALEKLARQEGRPQAELWSIIKQAKIDRDLAALKKPTQAVSKLGGIAKKLPVIGGVAALGASLLGSGDAAAAVGDLAIPGGLEDLGEGEDEMMLKIQDEDRKRRALEALAQGK